MSEEPKEILPELTDREKESHSAARDTIKHLVTLSTASVGIVVALFKDVLGEESGECTRFWVLLSVVVFGLSVVSGIMALMSLTGNLEKQRRPSIYQRNVTIFAALQIALFAGALILVGFAIYV